MKKSKSQSRLERQSQVNEDWPIIKLEIKFNVGHLY